MADHHVQLDADLYTVYASYKKATKAVVRWIATTASGIDLGQDGTKLTLKELMRAAITIEKSNCTYIPPRIPRAFRDAIIARKEITAFYKKHTKINNMETKKHEKFTETLREIYELLCDPKNSTMRDRISVNETTRSLPLRSTNVYDLLSPVPTKDTHVSVEDPAAGKGTCTSDGEASQPSKESPEQSFSLKDDGLAETFAIHYVVTNLDLTCTKIKEAWARAAAGSISIIFAAWLTTAAVEYLRSQFKGGSFSASVNAMNHRDVCEKYKSILGIDDRDISGAQFLARDSGQNVVFSSGHGLFCPLEAIIRGANTQPEENIQEMVVFENPKDFFTVEGRADDREHRYGAESILMDKILKSVKRRLLPTEDLRLEFLHEMNPLIKDIHGIYKNKDDRNILDASIQTNVVFGLQLLVESYKSFMFSKEPTPTFINCRIQTLKFAQDVKNVLTKMRASRPFIHDKFCECDYVCSSQILSANIFTLELDLMVFTKQKVFDIYYQAPWIAGSQMLEILSRATNLGVRLCSDHQVVWAVLHLYNLLRQCGALNKETVLLEYLCAAIGKQVFRGEPPQRDFWTRYIVCNGGRLQFDRSKKSKKDQGRYQHSDAHSERKWRLALPSSHAGFANHNHEINPHQTSIFAGLYRCGFRPSCVAWSYAWHGLDRNKFPPDKEITKVADEVAAHPFVFALDHLESAAGPELQGEFPTARLNWFEIFLTMTEILSELGQAAPTAYKACPECRKSPRDAEHWVSTGWYAVQELMPRADEYEDIGTSDFGSKCLDMVEPARNAICSAVRGKTTADYVWNV